MSDQNSIFSEQEILHLFQSDGILNPKALKKLLPKRTITSIECFWKRYPNKTFGALNGLPYELVAEFDPYCPYLWTNVAGGFKLCLWIDIQKSNSIPNELKPLINLMAEYQMWFYQADKSNIREKICKTWINGL